MHNSASITLTFKESAATSPGGLLESVSDLLICIAEKVSVNDVVPGHIKAVVTGKEGYVSFNCTRPGVVLRHSSIEDEAIIPTNALIHVEVILIGFSKEIIKTYLADCLNERSHLLENR